MSDEALRIRVTGLTLMDTLQAVAARAKNLTEPMRDCGEYLLRETHEHFKHEEGPDGTPWLPLSPATIKAKGHDNILHDSGRLQNSLTYRVSRTGFELGTNVVYGPIHQFGGTVEHEPREVTVRLATDARGNLLSQARDERGRHLPFGSPKATGRRRNLVVFAKEGAKRSIQGRFKVDAYKTTIPARPFLGVNNEDKTEFGVILKAYVFKPLAK